MGDARIGFCYAVLIENGNCKFGRTSDAFGRISSHVTAAQGFGLKVERVYLTEQVADCYGLERRLFDAIGADKWYSEYCGNMSQEKIEHLFKSLGVRFHSGKNIRNGSATGEVLFSEFPYTLKVSQRGIKGDGAGVVDKVMKYVEKHQPVRRGVLVNRVRTFEQSEVEITIDSLEREGRIKSVYLPRQRGDGFLHRYALPDYECEEIQ